MQHSVGYLKFKTYLRYSNHLNIKFIWIPDRMGIQYSNGKVMWVGRPSEYQMFWTINRLFQSGFQTITWIQDYLTTGHKSTIHLNTRLVRYSDGRWLMYKTSLGKDPKLSICNFFVSAKHFYIEQVFHRNRFTTNKWNKLSRLQWGSEYRESSIQMVESCEVNEWFGFLMVFIVQLV